MKNTLLEEKTATTNQQCNDEEQLSIEERLQNNGMFIIDDVITNDSIRQVLLSLIERNWKRSKEEVQIYLNSPGGYAADAWALVDIIHTVSFPVKTIALGRINSAAAVIVAAGDKGNRYATENTEIMIHQHSSCREGQYNQLVATQVGEEKEYQRHLHFWMKHSKYKTEKQIIDNIFKETDNFMTAQEAKKHGIIDHILETTGKKWK